MTDGLLSGLRVLDIGDTVGAAYCTRLLAGLGADVVVAEHPGRRGGLRTMGPFAASHVDDPEWSTAHLYFNAGKRSITLDIEDAEDRIRLLKLVPRFDLLVDSLTERRAEALQLTPARFQAARPGLTTVSVTPWGRTGPRADQPGDELTVQALSGFASLHGDPPREPLRLPGWQMECFAGTYAAIGAVAAMLDGGGRTVDVGVIEAAISAMESRLSSWEYTGKSPKRRLASFEGFYPLNIWPCSEGEVVLAFYHPRDWEGLAAILGDEELTTGDAFRSNNRRVRNRDAVDRRLSELLSTRTAREIFEVAVDVRSAVGMVMNAKTLLDDPHLRAREAIVEVEHPIVGRYSMPGAPFISSERRWRAARAPLLGEHNEEVLAGRDKPLREDRRSAATAGTFHPLRDIRVLDLTTAWAGPSATRMLGALGADVLKIESCTWYDGWRGPSTPPPPGVGSYADNDPGTLPHERTPLFGTANRNKRGITLDLTKAAGREIFHELLKRSDVVLSNFSSRVLPNLQLDYEHVRATRPDIIMLSMPGYGTSGPYENGVAYGSTMEAMAGLAARFGYADGPGQITHDLTYGDPVAGAHAAFAVVAALAYQKRTGRGLYIDLSQQETLLAQGGEALVKYSLDGELLSRTGSGDQTCAPSGYYPCAGDDGWVAISITDDDDWNALRRELPDARLADPRFATNSGRMDHLRELKRALAAITVQFDRHVLSARLATAGVASAPVLRFDEMRADHHVEARHAFEDVDHPEVGRRRFPRLPITIDGSPLLTTRHTPLFAQHNNEVYTGLLGLSEAAIEKMKLDGVTGETPSAR